MKETSLCVFVVKNRDVGLFFDTSYSYMVDTSLYSKMVRKVKLIHVALLVLLH